MAQPPEELIGIPISYIVRVCKVDPATARRWKRGATCLPYTALVCITGNLSAFGPQWKGWHLRRGQLISPEQWVAGPGDVMMVQLAQLQLGDYRRENRNLKLNIEDLKARLAEFEYEEQPKPDDRPVPNWIIHTG